MPVVVDNYIQRRLRYVLFSEVQRPVCGADVDDIGECQRNNSAFATMKDAKQISTIYNGQQIVCPLANEPDTANIVDDRFICLKAYQRPSRVPANKCCGVVPIFYLIVLKLWNWFAVPSIQAVQVVFLHHDKLFAIWDKVCR